MSKYNVCYFYANRNEAYDSVSVGGEYFSGDNLVTVIEKTDEYVTIRYRGSGKIRRLSRPYALKVLSH